MRDWPRSEQTFTPRPFLFVDDRANDALDFCRVMAEKGRGELLGLCTVVLLDVPGPDAQFAAVRMLLEYPDVQVISGPFNPPFWPDLSERLADLQAPARAGDDIDELLRRAKREDAMSALGRFRDVPPDAVQQETAFAQLLDDALRPGGAIVCDIELETLAFSRDDDKNPRAIFTALKEAYGVCERQATPEGDEPVQEKAQLIIVSAHRNYPCSLPRRLRNIGVAVTDDDFLQKWDDSDELVRRLQRRARERFPWSLKTRPPKEAVVTHRVGGNDEPILNELLDLVFWPETNGARQITGAAVKKGDKRKRAAESSGRARVLQILAERHLNKSPHALQTDEILQEIEATDKQDPPQLIFGIKRIFNDKDRDRILPDGHGGYRLGEAARIGLVCEADP